MIETIIAIGLGTAVGWWAGKRKKATLNKPDPEPVWKFTTDGNLVAELKEGRLVIYFSDLRREPKVLFEGLAERRATVDSFIDAYWEAAKKLEFPRLYCVVIDSSDVISDLYVDLKSKAGREEFRRWVKSDWFPRGMKIREVVYEGSKVSKAGSEIRKVYQ